MDVTNDAIEYISDTFLSYGTVASREDIARVFIYEERWWDQQLEGTEFTVSVADQDDVIDYILKHKPGLTHSDVEEILDLEDEAFSAVDSDDV